MITFEERLEKCFVIVFPDLSQEEIRRASQASLATWDSVNTLTLLNVVEEEFGTKIDLEAVGELVSFALIVDYLKEHLNAT